jgi:hypothetical protein
VEGQLNDLKTENLLTCDMFIHITGETQELIDSCINLINNYKINKSIRTSTENLYEYPGLKYMYDVSQVFSDKIILYMHTKGMFFSNFSNYRSKDEQMILRYTIKNYQNILTLFENKNINKIGLFPSPEGKIFFNFFWIKSNYLKDKPAPIISSDRHYYKNYISFTNNFSDCCSLITNSIYSFDTDAVSGAMDAIKQSEYHKNKNACPHLIFLI